MSLFIKNLAAFPHSAVRTPSIIRRGTTPFLSRALKLGALLGLLAGQSLLGAISVQAGTSEGIKVHGDWVVTVNNADGSIAQQHTFQNALVDTGKNLLVLMLAPDPAPEAAELTHARELWHLWAVTSGTNDTVACDGDPHLGTGYNGENFAVVSGRTGSSFVLTNSFSLPANCIEASTYSVSTVNSTYDTQVQLEGALYPSWLIFTSKTLDDPITGILPDQIVTLKVTISFD
jgi:hypothetical protein